MTVAGLTRQRCWPSCWAAGCGALKWLLSRLGTHSNETDAGASWFALCKGAWLANLSSHSSVCSLMLRLAAATSGGEGGDGVVKALSPRYWIPDSVFQVPEGYQSVTAGEILKDMMGKMQGLRIQFRSSSQ